MQKFQVHIYNNIFSVNRRAFMYMYPFNVINWAKTVLLSGVMSVLMGGVFIGIRWKYFDAKWIKDPIFEQDNINDRLGFHHCIMAVGIWPMLLCMISEAWREKGPVTRDVEDGLYSKLAYIMTKVSYAIMMQIAEPKLTGASNVRFFKWGVIITF